MEGGGTDSYCVAAGRRGDDVLIPTRVVDEVSIHLVIGCSLRGCR